MVRPSSKMRRIVLRVIDRWLSGRRGAVRTPVLSSGAVQIFRNVMARARCSVVRYSPRQIRPLGDLLTLIGYPGNGEGGTNLAVLACMAKIVGAAGAHAGKQSVAAFKKMVATLLVVVAVIAFAEGVMLTSVVTLRGRLSWYLIPAGVGLLMLWVARLAHFRVKKHEAERLKWR